MTEGTSTRVVKVSGTTSGKVNNVLQRSRSTEEGELVGKEQEKSCGVGTVPVRSR
jgi:hypothetical protein